MAVAAGAIAGMVRDLRVEPVTILAGRLSAGGRYDAAALAAFAGRRDLDGYRSGCRGDALRAALTVRLHQFDAARGAGDPAAMDAAYEGVETAARAVLACSPLDGNAWLRLAMVDLQILGPVPAVLDELNMSYWVAPNEGWIIADRIAFAARLVDTGLAGVSGTLARDVRKYAASAEPKDVAALFSAAPVSARDEFQAALAFLPAERRQQIEKIIAENAGSAGN
ncbi:MAG: hypothetical protein R3D02_13020 [Hyphomicrobiales bacterium]